MCRRPIKLSDLKKAEDIFHAVNQLFVTCKKCGQSNIRRGQFNDHIENFCCETISNNDMNSDRTIMNKRIESLISQPLRQTQRIREELERQKTTIDNNNNQINNSINTINGNLEEQKDEIQILRQSIVTHRRKIQKLEHTVQIQQEKIEAQENYIDQLETNNRCFQNQIRRLNDNFDEYESRMGNLEETMNRKLK
jgi:chromosome segregation ATPase